MRKIVLFLFLSFSLLAHEDYSQLAPIYAKRKVAGTNYLAFRDIPKLLVLADPSDRPIAVMDYGCGTGRSTRFIREIVHKESTVVGVDPSSDMLEQALLQDPQGVYLKMEKEIPFPDDSFDLVYSNFVLFELESREEIVRVLTEVKRTLKPGAYLIATTGAPPLYDRNNHWATLDPDFPQNDNPTSGSIVRIKAEIPGGETITFDDYFWTEKDYLDCFAEVGFYLLTIHHPLGRQEDSIEGQWKDETHVSPYVTFVLRKG